MSKKPFDLVGKIPKFLSDNVSERMVENEDTTCNLKHVRDAFVFCPIPNSIEMDNIMTQELHLSEKDDPYVSLTLLHAVIR